MTVPSMTLHEEQPEHLAIRPSSDKCPAQKDDQCYRPRELVKCFTLLVRHIELSVATTLDNVTVVMFIPI